ncbi:unnamed protein product, partial [Vitis vinifera]
MGIEKKKKEKKKPTFVLCCIYSLHPLAKMLEIVKGMIQVWRSQNIK